MIDFVGLLPPEWEGAWQTLQASCSFLHEPPPKPTLVTKFREEVPEEELAPLLDVIQGLMRFRPTDRLTARAALDLLLTDIIPPPC
ncbi:serine kinase [Cordyceps militaris]|uniref:Serine kinase n=1 Tax=Cordyceps militaris TaxID=73501 RepID=A0A2H4S5G7_CORMI|nr:serine kinase [Cordyceps militaris]